ncbi:TrbC/VirB2 family protein [Sphingomonas sp.]|uniref:TrbC/VirB2 family protein n=1 Tax=Sphingomonas sp. TaxID=28214 RepID=UPI0039C9954E
MVPAYPSALADPDGSSALVAAAAWVQGTLLGTVATTVAVIAVASVGFLMLSGRVSFRYGVTVIAGCFVLFGASSIVGGITGVAGSDGAATQTYAAPPPVPAAEPPVAATPAAPYDPYAGASVPPQ